MPLLDHPNKAAQPAPHIEVVAGAAGVARGLPGRKIDGRRVVLADVVVLVPHLKSQINWSQYHPKPISHTLERCNTDHNHVFFLNVFFFLRGTVLAALAEASVEKN